MTWPAERRAAVIFASLRGAEVWPDQADRLTLADGLGQSPANGRRHLIEWRT